MDNRDRLEIGVIPVLKVTQEIQGQMEQLGSQVFREIMVSREILVSRDQGET